MKNLKYLILVNLVFYSISPQIKIAEVDQAIKITDIDDLNPKTAIDLINQFIKEKNKENVPEFNKKQMLGHFLLTAAMVGNIKIVEHLINNNANINFVNNQNETPLMVAAKYVRPEIFKLLINSGADITQKDSLNFGIRTILYVDSVGYSNGLKIHEMEHYLCSKYNEFDQFINQFNSSVNTSIYNALDSFPREITNIIANYAQPSYLEYFEMMKNQPNR